MLMIHLFEINANNLLQDYIQLWQEKVADRILMTVCILNIYNFSFNLIY